MSRADAIAADIAAGAAPPATLIELHASIKARMAPIAAAFWGLATKSLNVKRAPTVNDGWLPPKPGADAEQYPFILVRPREGNDTEQGADQTATAMVDVVLGVYGDDDDTWLDLLLLIQAIRGDLAEQPTIAGTAFEHTGPLTWSLDEQQPRPQWHAVVQTKWTIPRPYRIEARNPQGG